MKIWHDGAKQQCARQTKRQMKCEQLSCLNMNWANVTLKLLKQTSCVCKLFTSQLTVSKP